jgi:7-cyano-7-deazaguanine synthase
LTNLTVLQGKGRSVISLNSESIMHTAPKAVVLLSGGLDSTTTLAWARHHGYQTYALTVRYGQRHELEVEAARRIAEQLGVAEHRVLEIDLRQFGGSALTTELPVPKHEFVEEIESEIPITYVPARNTVFLSCALAWAEVLDSRDLFIGVNALDYSGYPDCRPAFIEAFQTMANLATKAGIEGRGIRIHAPLIQMTKAEIIRTGLNLGIDYRWTTSCYDPTPDGLACGRCDACLLRKRGFAENGCVDPAPYCTRSPTFDSQAGD